HTRDLSGEHGEVAAAVIGEIGRVVVGNGGDGAQIHAGRINAGDAKVEEGGGGLGAGRLAQQGLPDRVVGERRPQQQHRRTRHERSHDLRDSRGVRRLKVMGAGERRAGGPGPAGGDLAGKRDYAIGGGKVRREVIEGGGRGREDGSRQRFAHLG